MNIRSFAKRLRAFSPTTLVLAVIVGVSDSPAPGQSVSPERVDFNEQIRPIFVRHCTECHGGVKQAGDLSLVYEDQVADLLEPGNPDDSYLFQRIIADDDDERMPPPDHGDSLSQSEIATFRRWISQGAKWGKHWAYQIPKRQTPPAVNDQTWCRQPIDFFILARLEASGLKPSRDETPERWLRRASLDLIGLPPSLAFRSEFLGDVKLHGEPAYAHAVDRMLVSQGFGERWASVWFDQVRYADSRGLGLDGRRTIWKYRDWVIDAFNQDMPYDQFTLKQMAGDLLPEATLADRVATAVHRLTQSNEEGGTDDEEFRIAAVLDRVNTTWQTWQGTTFGCVQCHHHPYDPFTHEDYYRSVAFFNNTADSDLNDDWPLLRVPIDSADLVKATELTNQIDRLSEQLWQQQFDAVSDESLWQPLRTLAVSSPNTEMGVEENDEHEEFRTLGTVPRDLQITIEAPLGSLQELTAIRLTVLPLNPAKALADSEWGFVLSQFEANITVPGDIAGDDGEPQPLSFSLVVGDEANSRYEPSRSLVESSDGFAAYTRIHHPRRVVLILKDPVALRPAAKLTIRLRHKMLSGGSHPLSIKRGHLAVSSKTSLTTLVNDPPLVELKKELDSLTSQLSEIKSTTVPVMRERAPNLRRPTHVFNRGLFLTKGELVTAGIPQSLLPEGVTVTDRLQLAQWFVDPRNPLTSRVAVNRHWSRVFGTGLVSTEEDFGSTGEPPSHPGLLDDLAVRFREDYRWSVKKLLREIVLSRAYRQSSRSNETLTKRDPSNRLIARGPRNALAAEIVRDQMLVISGLLVKKMHGPPVHPPLPDGVWRPFAGGDKWKTATKGQPDRYRRSIYTYVKRSIPFPMLAVFDAPTREFCAPRRLRSNTPLQSLATLNDEAFVECAEAFSGRMREHPGSLAEQIRYGFLSATSRVASESEIEVLLRLHERVRGDSDGEMALKSVAAVLLNLDELLNQ